MSYVSDLLTNLFVDSFLNHGFRRHDVEEERHQDTRRFIATNQKDEGLRKDFLVTQC